MPWILLQIPCWPVPVYFICLSDPCDTGAPMVNDNGQPQSPHIAFKTTLWCSKDIIEGQGGAPLPCTSCVNLQNHAIIMGIQHRALDGANENTPWTFLSAGQMLTLLQRKTHIINRLKLQSLNAAQKIGIRN